MDYLDRIIGIHYRMTDRILSIMEAAGIDSIYMPEDSDIRVVWYDSRTGLPYGCRILEIYKNRDSVSAYLEEIFSLDNFLIHGFQGDWVVNLHALIEVAAIAADTAKTKLNHINKDDMKKDFSEQIKLLRKEITGAIIGLLQSRGLSELCFPDPELHPDAPDSVSVIFFDNDGDPYECVVNSIHIEQDGISLTATSKSDDSVSQTESRFDLSLRSPIWLNEILLTAQALLENCNINQNNT